MAPPPWLAAAWREHGVRETRGSAHTSRILDYARSIGVDWVKSDETPWCAAFVGACLKKGEQKSSGSMRARSYSTFGEAVSPVPGAIVVLSRGSNPAFGHVGFLVREDGGHFWLLGGNQNDAVTLARFPRSRLVAMRWPNGYPVPTGTSADTPFQGALRHVLAQEGGWSDDPHDPCGATNRGVTIAVLARSRNVTLTPSNRSKLLSDLRNLSDEECAAIYFTRYWQRSKVDFLPAGLGLFHFDCAVNQGPGRATRLLQAALNVSVDGEIGPLTLAAAHRAEESKALASYAALRRRHYRGLPHFWRFGRGWLARVDRTLAAAREEISVASARVKQPSEGAPPSETFIPGAPGTFNEETEKMTQAPKWWGQSITIWGSFITAMATVLPLLGPFIGLDITSDMIELVGEQVTQLLQITGGIIGTAMAIFGRVRASQPLMQRDMRLDLKI